MVGYDQRRSQNEAKEAMALPEKTCFFTGVLYQSQQFEIKRNSRTHVVSCSLTDQGLT